MKLNFNFKEIRFFYIRCQRIQSDSYSMITKLELLFLWCGRISKGIWYGYGGNKSVHSNCFSYWNQVRHLNDGDAFSFNFSCHRCTATCTGPSCGGQNCSSDSILFQFSGDFFSHSRSFGLSCSSTNGGEEVFIYSADLSFLLIPSHGI
jgi:hypothetical protein